MHAVPLTLIAFHSSLQGIFRLRACECWHVQLTTHGDNVISTWSEDGSGADICSSWQQCVQYLDETPVTKVQLQEPPNNN